MATPNRMAILTKMHKVLKKHYKPAPIPDRPVLEHLLYACCLENAQYEAADKAFEAVSTGFFDWNEVRVSTVKELAEVMNMLPDAQQAAAQAEKVAAGRLRVDLFVRPGRAEKAEPGTIAAAAEEI